MLKACDTLSFFDGITVPRCSECDRLTYHGRRLSQSLSEIEEEMNETVKCRDYDTLLQLAAKAERLLAGMDAAK